MTDRFAGTPNSITAGESLPIKFTDTSKANQEVEIEISNGAGETVLRTIQLNGDGVGTTGFTVPTSWITVQLNGPNSSQHAVAVAP